MTGDSKKNYSSDKAELASLLGKFSALGKNRNFIFSDEFIADFKWWAGQGQYGIIKMKRLLALINSIPNGTKLGLIEEECQTVMGIQHLVRDMHDGYRLLYTLDPLNKKFTFISC